MTSDARDPQSTHFWPNDAAHTHVCISHRACTLIEMHALLARVWPRMLCYVHCLQQHFWVNKTCALTRSTQAESFQLAFVFRMSNVVTATGAIVVAVVWLFASTVYTIVSEYVAGQISLLYASHMSSISSSCDVVSFGGVTVSGGDFIFFRRLVERVEQKLEYHQWSVSIALYVVESPLCSCLLLCCILLGVGGAVWFVGARRDGRRTPARKTHSRVIQCRGGGALS